MGTTQGGYYLVMTLGLPTCKEVPCLHLGLSNPTLNSKSWTPHGPIKDKCINFMGTRKLPLASPLRRLVAGFPTLCFRGLFRKRFRLKCFRGAFAKGILKIKKKRASARASAGEVLPRNLPRAQWEALLRICCRPISEVISVPQQSVTPIFWS